MSFALAVDLIYQFARAKDGVVPPDDPMAVQCYSEADYGHKKIAKGDG